MDRIQDKASKFFTDVRKKKVALNKKPDLSDSNREHFKNMFTNKTILSNNCCYCDKAFIDSKFLLKHILRRHAEDFILLHRKCLNLESNNNSCDLKFLLDVIREEFSVLRKEIIAKQISKEPEDENFYLINEKAAHFVEKSDLQPNVSSLSVDHECNDNHESEQNFKGILPNDNIKQHGVGYKQHNTVKEKVLGLESNVKCLHDKFERLDSIVKTEVLSKHDIYNLISANENKILKAQEVQFVELRRNLQKDLNRLSNQLSDNNAECKSQISELHKDIERLDLTVDLIRKQIHSPDQLKALEKKLEKQIVKFLSSNNGSLKPRVSKRNSSVKNHSFVADQTVSSLNYNKTMTNYKEGISNIQESNFYDNVYGNKASCFTTYEMSSIVAEKMESLGIDPCASKIPQKQYEEKMKHINTIKSHHVMQNKNFLHIYDRINAYADHRVISKHKHRKRKLRFSEPLIFSRNINKSRQKINQNQTFHGLGTRGHENQKSSQNQTYPCLGKGNEISELHLDPEISELHVLNKNVLPKFQNIYKNGSLEISEPHIDIKSPVISEPHIDIKSPVLSEPHILNENFYTKPSWLRFQNITYPPTESISFSQNISASDIGGGDGVNHFKEMQIESEKQLESTPLRDSAPDVKSFKFTMNAKESNNTSFTNTGKPLCTDKKDRSFVPVSNDLCQKNFLVQENKTIGSTSKNYLEEKMKILDEDLSSLESLSSWDDDENS